MDEIGPSERYIFHYMVESNNFVVLQGIAKTGKIQGFFEKLLYKTCLSWEIAAGGVGQHLDRATFCIPTTTKTIIFFLSKLEKIKKIKWKMKKRFWEHHEFLCACASSSRVFMIKISTRSEESFQVIFFYFYNMVLQDILEFNASFENGKSYRKKSDGKTVRLNGIYNIVLTLFFTFSTVL